MAEHAIESTGQVPLPADTVWSVVSDFCGSWHPAIATISAEYDNSGRLTRAFGVHGDDTTYRERLTWYSNSDRSLAYSHVEGIAGVMRYEGRMQVTPVAIPDANADSDGNQTHCSVTLSAKLTAEEPRATEIANGTKAIFDDAIAAIRTQAMKIVTIEPTPTQTSHSQIATEIQSRTIDGDPQLTASYCKRSCQGSCQGADSSTDTLCLFLHGIGGNRTNWNQQLSAVATHCTAAAMDLRGYGNSASGPMQSTIDDYCNDILRVADSFAAKKLILCGLSYGAWIATSFATRYAERLSALILSGGCTGMSEASKSERDAFRQNREVPLNKGQTPADFADAVVALLAGPDITDSAEKELLASMQAIPSATYADALRCFTNPPEIFDFSTLTMPVLLMTGDADKLAPPAEIKQVAERIHAASPNPDVRFECLPRAGHVCNLEVPDAYNAPLLALVQRVL